MITEETARIIYGLEENTPIASTSLLAATRYMTSLALWVAQTKFDTGEIIEKDRIVKEIEKGGKNGILTNEGIEKLADEAIQMAKEMNGEEDDVK